jgi:hypothetical protein
MTGIEGACRQASMAGQSAVFGTSVHTRSVGAGGDGVDVDSGTTQPPNWHTTELPRHRQRPVR